jgi:hypothetical protein
VTVPGELDATGVTPAWHALDAATVLTALASTPRGLASAAARDRLSRSVPNRFPELPRRGVARRFLAQFHNVLIYVLVVAGLVSLLLGHALDGAVILGVVLVNGVVGCVQEGRAEEALAAIRRLIDPTVAVLRHGRRGAGVRCRDLLRQDGHAHAQRDGPAGGRHGRGSLRGQRGRLCAGWRVRVRGRHDRSRDSPRARGPAGGGPPVQRRRAAPGRRRLARRG